MSAPRPSSLGRKLALSAATLILVILAAELGLRLGTEDPLAAYRDQEWRELFIRPSEDPLLVYEPTPGSRGQGWGCEIAINSHGFRDREYTPEKPAGVRRVAVLGDSITFGNMLPVEATFPEVLEARLAKAGLSIEVLNLGVGGYDTLQETVFLERVGLDFDPDLAVVAYCINDVGTVSLQRSYLEGIERYRSWIYRSRILLWLRLQMDRGGLTHAHAAQNRDERFRADNRGHIDEIAGDERLAKLMEALRARLDADGVEEVASPILSWYTSPAHVGKLRHAFRRLGDLSRARGLPVVVAILPHLDEAGIPAAYDLAYAIVAHEARQAGLDVLMLADEVRAAGPEGLQLNPADGIHYDAEGQESLADWIGRFLLRAGYLEE